MPATLLITPSKQGLEIKGDLVYATASEGAKQATKALLSHQENSVSIDCNQLAKLDSAGIALLIDWQRWCYENKKQCHFVDIKEKALSLISTYNLKNILNID